MHCTSVICMLLVFFFNQMECAVNSNGSIERTKRAVNVITSKSFEILSEIENILIDTHIRYLKRATSTINDSICDIYTELSVVNENITKSCMETRFEDFTRAFSLAQLEIDKCSENGIHELEVIHSNMLEAKRKLLTSFKKKEISFALRQQNLTCTTSEWPKMEEWSVILQKVEEYRKNFVKLEEYQLLVSQGLLENCCQKFLQTIPSFIALQRSKIDGCVQNKKKAGLVDHH